jgi:hypothetical protein
MLQLSRQPMPAAGSEAQHRFLRYRGATHEATNGLTIQYMLPYRDEATFPIQRFGFDYRDRNGGSLAVRRLRAPVLSDFVLKRADPGQRQLPGAVPIRTVAQTY